MSGLRDGSVRGIGAREHDHGGRVGSEGRIAQRPIAAAGNQTLDRRSPWHRKTRGFDLQIRRKEVEGGNAWTSATEHRRKDPIDTHDDPIVVEPWIVADSRIVVQQRRKTCKVPSSQRIAGIFLGQIACRRLAMRYLFAHPECKKARVNVISIAIVGERCARLRHLIGAYSWEE